MTFSQKPGAWLRKPRSKAAKGAHVRASRTRRGAMGPHKRPRGFGAQPRQNEDQPRLVENHRGDEDEDGEHDDPLPGFLFVFSRDQLERDAAVGINDIAEKGVR